MRVLISGSSGFIGSALSESLAKDGHEVIRLVRSLASSGKDSARWDPLRGMLDPSGLEGMDVVVHLAGESLMASRWSTKKKQKIYESRVAGTRLLSKSLSRLKEPPRVLVCASATGFYGDRGDEILREDDSAGKGFLAEVCRDWENASLSAIESGIRVAHLRFGIVLGASGGALKLMLRPFRMGLGGVLGSGAQYMSWISLDDAVGAIRHAIARDVIQGPVNAAAPYPVTNKDFTSTLARVLQRPALCPLPKALARFLFGEMADEMLLVSSRLEPARLTATGYAFLYPELEGALRHLLVR